MATSERLELGLLVGRDHVVVCAKCLAVEDPLVEVEDAVTAFSAKSGSRGRSKSDNARVSIAAAANQRRTVEDEIDSTSLSLLAWAASSCELQRDS